jgi:hypothetical protein
LDLQVRFQDLEVPTDAQVVLAALREEAQQAAVVEVPPGSLAEDLRGEGLLGNGGGGGSASGVQGRGSAGSSEALAVAPAGG